MHNAQSDMRQELATRWRTEIEKVARIVMDPRV